jgi:hypothetical protein
VLACCLLLDVGRHLSLVAAQARPSVSTQARGARDSRRMPQYRKGDSQTARGGRRGAHAGAGARAP